MADILKVTSEYPVSVVLIIFGFLLAASLLFESYFGLRPRPEMRQWTGGIGLVLVLVGLAMLVVSLIERSQEKLSVAAVWAGQWDHESRYGSGEVVEGELEFTGRQGDYLFGEFVNTSRGGNEGGCSCWEGSWSGPPDNSRKLGKSIRTVR